MKDDPVVIVTGASRGLGAAVACWLGKSGAAVTLVARSEKDLAHVGAAVGEKGGEALIVPCDITDPDDCANAVHRTLARFGRIDSLVNNAGIVTPLARIANTDPAQFRHNLDVNLLGPFHMVNAAIDALRKEKGRIVNVSSGASKRVIQAAAAYCIAKAGLNHFTRVLAAEETDITAVSVRPGVVDSRMQQTLRTEGAEAMPHHQAVYYQDLLRHGQLEPPEIPGRAVAWLALKAPAGWSGRYLDYDNAKIRKSAIKTFGETL